MDAINDNCHQILQLKRDRSDSVANRHIRNLFKLSRDLFEKEMPFLTWDFRKRVSVPIDLSIYRIF